MPQSTYLPLTVTVRLVRYLAVLDAMALKLHTFETRDHVCAIGHGYLEADDL